MEFPESTSPPSIQSFLSTFDSWSARAIIGSRFSHAIASEREKRIGLLKAFWNDSMVRQNELQARQMDTDGDLTRTLVNSSAPASSRRLYSQDISEQLATRSMNMSNTETFIIKYTESIWPYLIPLAVSVFLVTAVIPLMILLCCSARTYRSRRFFKCLCGARLLFKYRSDNLNIKEMQARTNTSTAIKSLELKKLPRDRLVKTLTLRRPLLGLRYLLLLFGVCGIILCISLGIFELLEAQRVFTEVACHIGLAASALVNGQAPSATDGTSTSDEDAAFTILGEGDSPFRSEDGVFPQKSWDAKGWSRISRIGRQPDTGSPPEKLSWTVNKVPVAQGYKVLHSDVLAKRPYSSEQAAGVVPKGNVKLTRRKLSESVEFDEADPQRPSMLNSSITSDPRYEFSRLLEQILNDHESEVLESSSDVSTHHIGSTGLNQRDFPGIIPVLDSLVYFNSAIDTRGTGTILEEISQTEEISKQLLELIVMISARVELLQQMFRDFSEHMDDDADATTTDTSDRRFHIPLSATTTPGLLAPFRVIFQFIPQIVDSVSRASKMVSNVLDELATMQQNGNHISDIVSSRPKIMKAVEVGHRITNPIPSVYQILFWALIAVFAATGSILLVVALDITRRCCCNQRRIVAKERIPLGCSGVSLAIAISVLMAGGVLLVLTVVLTDVCEFSDKYFRTASDVDVLLHRMDLLDYTGAGNGSASVSPSPVALALAGCFLPGQERDIAKFLGIEKWTELARKFCSDIGESKALEMTFERFLSVEVQSAALALEAFEETYSLVIPDRIALQEAGEAERWNTYVQVRYSGIQDKQLVMSTWVLDTPNNLNAPSTEVLPTTNDGGIMPSDTKPFDFLGEIKKYSEHQQVDIIEVISGVRSTLAASQGDHDNVFELLGENQSFQQLVEFLRRVPRGKRAQLIRAVAEIAVGGNLENNPSNVEDSMSNKNSQQREDALAFLKEARQYHASENAIVVFGLQDIEDLIFPFYFGSLHDGQDNGADRSPIYRIDGNFDPTHPSVMEVAELKDDEHERLRFLNAVWWAVQKVKLRETPVQSSACLLSGSGNNGDNQKCDFDEVVQATAVTIGQLKTDVGRLSLTKPKFDTPKNPMWLFAIFVPNNVQVEKLWQTLRRFYTSRNRIYSHLLEIEKLLKAVDQLNCAGIFHSVSPAQEMMCDDAVHRVANISLVLCIMGVIALVLFSVYFCVWRASVFNHWSETDTVYAEVKRQKLLDTPTVVSNDSARPMLTQKTAGHGWRA